MAVKITELFIHVGFEPVVIAVATVGAALGITDNVILALVAIVVLTQFALEVNTTLIMSPFKRLVPVKPV